jgi:hypothetical protein
MRIRHFSVALVSLVAMFGLVGGDAHASPILLTSFAVPYTQDFDTLASTGTSAALPAGWAISTATYTADNGNSMTGGIKSYGATPPSKFAATERALGSLATGATGTLFYGAEFENATGKTIDRLDISYTGEQWRRGKNMPQRAETLFFEYSLNATSVTDALATWTSVSSLDFTSPNTSSTSPSALDGNAAANRTSLSATINGGLSIADGAVFWIRYRDPNDTGEDHGLGVDGFSLMPLAVPEPGSAILLALTMGGFGFLYRRRMAGNQA